MNNLQQQPSTPDPPSDLTDPYGTTGRAWYLYNDEMKIFIRFLEISGEGDRSIGRGGNIRLQWHEPGSVHYPTQESRWKNWETSYTNAYCPTWYARDMWHTFHTTGYYQFIPVLHEMKAS
jgi:hypothetical protein